MHHAVMFTLCLLMHTIALDDIYYPNNLTALRTTLSGVAEYRAALTLDWLAAEDSRQRELALAFETEAAPSVQVIASDCISYPKPASGKVARLMLELLKNLEGDEATYIPELIQSLIRAKLLVETSMLEAEPDLESLVKTPSMMMGEPHATFPRILSMIWMTATDPSTVNKDGWCSIQRVSKYLMVTSPAQIARHMRSLEPVIARARFVMEEFIRHVTPNMYDKKNHHLVMTTLMPGYPVPVGRTRYHVNVRPKMRQSWIKTLSSTTSMTKVTMGASVMDDQEPFEDTRHQIVSNPDLEDYKKRSDKSIAEIVKFSVYLLVFDWTMVGLIS